MGQKMLNKLKKLKIAAFRGNVEVEQAEKVETSMFGCSVLEGSLLGSKGGHFELETLSVGRGFGHGGSKLGGEIN